MVSQVVQLVAGRGMMAQPLVIVDVLEIPEAAVEAVMLELVVKEEMVGRHLVAVAEAGRVWLLVVEGMAAMAL
jgi:hypothetical protein